MVKKQIVMTQGEYDSQREKLIGEITSELEFEYRKVPVWTPVLGIIAFGWLLPNIWEGYNYYPVWTSITSGVSTLLYGFMIYLYIRMMKKYLTGTK